MLSGEYSHSIDSKGRVIIPVKFREQLGKEFMITNGLDGCLFIFPLKEWNIFESQLRTHGVLSSKGIRTLTRYFVGGGVVSTIDKTGRTLLPIKLRKNVNIGKNVMLVGVLNRIEIWDMEVWNNKNAEVYKNVDDIAASLNELGINL